MKKLNVVLVVILLYFSAFAEGVKVNVSSGKALEVEVFVPNNAIWIGVENNNWHNVNNWDTGIIPDAGTSVSISPTAVYDPSIFQMDAECLEILIPYGKIISILDEKLTVNKDMFVFGKLIMQENGAKLHVKNDIVWEDNSVASIQSAYASIEVEGDWRNKIGSIVNLNGEVKFSGIKNSQIINQSANASFSSIKSLKAGAASLNYSNLSSEDLVIKKNLYIFNGSKFRSDCDGNIVLKGHLINNSGADFQLDKGTVILGGHYQIISFYEPGLFNNLRINSSYLVKLNRDISIKNDLFIDSGKLNVNSHDIEIGGDWNNSVGTDGFIEDGGRVIFNGAMHQNCDSEEFDELELNKLGGDLRVNGSIISCQKYDWTSGGIDVKTGIFKAISLADNGIYGSYYLSLNGKVILSSTTLVDLNADLTFDGGGEMHIFNGNGDSFWAFGSNASITMDGGLLEFHDVGISLTGPHALNTNITGGIIRTAGSFKGTKAGFNPTGGTVECVTDSDGDLGFSNGSFFNNLKINKKNNGRMEMTKDLIVKGMLTIEEGQLFVKDNELTTFEKIIVEGELELGDNSVLKIDGDKALTIKNGGKFNSFASANHPALVTHKDILDYYSFTVENGGNIAAEYTTFEYLQKYGVNIKSGATVALVHAFANCTFQLGEDVASSRLLTINNSQNLTISDASFPILGGAHYNIAKTVNTGHITMISANGFFSGEDFEYDLNNRVDWKAFLSNDSSEEEVIKTTMASSEKDNLIQDELEIQIFPNPTTGKINIQFENTSKREVRIMNMLGKIVVNRTINTLNESINISDFNNGVYFIHILTGDEVYTSKIIKQ